VRLNGNNRRKRIKEGTDMCCIQPELAIALMELRVEEARRSSGVHRIVIPLGKRLERQAGFVLAHVGAWLVSLGEHLARTTQAQPLT
jgi:hypothetical protein